MTEANLGKASSNGAGCSWEEKAFIAQACAVGVSTVIYEPETSALYYGGQLAILRSYPEKMGRITQEAELPASRRWFAAN